MACRDDGVEGSGTPKTPLCCGVSKGIPSGFTSLLFLVGDGFLLVAALMAAGVGATLLRADCVVE